MPADPVSRASGAAAFAVHILTASGAALGLLALLAAVASNWALMFAFLGVALFVDGVDGMLARRLDVAARLPRWSGDTLDLVVDFLTYVFMPAYRDGGERPAAACRGRLARDRDRDQRRALLRRPRMKTEDNYFRGFPTLWNAAAFYLVPAAARSVDRRRRDCRARRAHLRSGSLPASVPRAAVARFQRAADCRMGGACGLRAGPRYVARRVGDSGAVCHRAFTFSAPGCCVARNGVKCSSCSTILMRGRRWSR